MLHVEVILPVVAGVLVEGSVPLLGDLPVYASTGTSAGSSAPTRGRPSKFLLVILLDLDLDVETDILVLIILVGLVIGDYD